MRKWLWAGCLFAGSVLAPGASLTFDSGSPTNLMAMASRPGSPGRLEVETADDFVTTTPVFNLTGGGFYGLLTGGAALADIASVNVEIYRVFPLDSDVSRTSGPPTFSTPNVPTRVNSPSDVAISARESGLGELAYTVNTLSASFTALNSAGPTGINPSPNQRTGGNGAVTGIEVALSFVLTSPISLAPGHYFFVPQVGLSKGEFYWLSGTRPISGTGTTPFSPDLQAWIRDANLDPDWLRVGTDIVGGTTPPTFNAAFFLTGNDTVPEPGSFAMLAGGLAAVAYWRRRRV